MNEESLITEIKNGKTSAFDQLIDKYKQKALAIVYSNIGSWNDSDDIVQEVFIKVYHSLDRFRGECSFSTWFYRIVINSCNDYFRKKAVKSRFFVSITEREDDEGNVTSIFENYPSTVKDGRAELMRKELGEAISRAIAALPRKQRLIFTLKNIHGFKIAEIAELTDIAEGTVKAQLFQAIDKLKKALR